VGAEAPRLWDLCRKGSLAKAEEGSMCASAGGRRDLAAAAFPARGTQTRGNLRHPTCSARPLWCPSHCSCWGLCTGGSVPPTQLHSSLAPHTPRLHRRLAGGGLCYSPPPSPGLKANLCSCRALAAGRLSVSQMERHGGSPPFPACLLQASSPDL